MISYELETNYMAAAEVAANLAGNWMIITKGRTKILVEDIDIDTYLDTMEGNENNE